MNTGTNKGKKFEQNFAQYIKKAKEGQVFCYRIKDTDSSYNPTATSKYTHPNKCDYFMFYEGVLYALELKSTCYKSISFELIDENTTKMIKPHQIRSLTEMGKYKNLVAGFVLNFRNEELGTEDTYFLSIEQFNEFASNTDKKSINPVDIVAYGGIVIETTKKRVWCSYNIDNFIDELQNKR